jgi:hypothetical protein
MGREAGDVTIIKLLDPTSWQVEPSPNGEVEVGEACVFNIPLRGLLVDLLVLGDFISKSLQLVTKLLLHFMVGVFTGFDGCEQSVTDGLQGDCINNIANGLEGGCNCAG